MSLPRLVVGGVHSGVGKTTVSVGLMAALRRRGLVVAPFKVGPDYLDPGYHRAASGRPSAPLDLWMLGEEGVRESFARGCAGADFAVIEGMMGLYDGIRAEGNAGSTADLARRLGAPVLLVLDGSALARSAGAVALGFRRFDRRVRFAGVVANRVAGEAHAALLRAGIEDGAGLPFLGWLPEDPQLAFPERHLGLVPAEPSEALAERVERVADAVERGIDLAALLAAARRLSEPVPPPDRPLAGPPLGPLGGRRPVGGRGGAQRVRLAVAMDEAFCFYYPDNLALLEAAGAELVPFSPLRDRALPSGCRGLYLGGGYPELHAARLAANRSMRAAIRRLARAGAPIYAECGGWMALCQALVDADGVEHRMVGLVPGRTRLQPRLQAIGYREVLFLRDTPLGPAGSVARGHEFRYSRYEGTLPEDALAFAVGEDRVGYARGGLLASYIHLHFGSCPSLAVAFVEAARRASGCSG